MDTLVADGPTYFFPRYKKNQKLKFADLKWTQESGTEKSHDQ